MLSLLFFSLNSLFCSMYEKRGQRKIMHYPLFPYQLCDISFQIFTQNYIIPDLVKIKSMINPSKKSKPKYLLYINA